ncbi:MAG: AEC family transporter [Myxococcota bacterium]
MPVVWNTIVPIAAIVVVGYWLAGRQNVHTGTFAELALWVTSPALLFSVLADTTLDAERFLGLAGGTLAVAAGTGLVAAVWQRWTGAGRGFLLASIFFNGGNMGLASARLAFGEAGLEAGAVVFVSIALCTSLAGIWIAKGENGLGEALRHPMLWGSAGGLLMAGTGTELPKMVMEPIHMLGAMAIPLMLLNLGGQLRRLRVDDVGHSFVAVGIRMGGGFAIAWGFISLVGITGVDRQVLLLMSAMPAAVINAVLAEQYGTDEGIVASAILIGTVLSLVVIPVVLLVVT